jgi:hypothetical protein
VICWSTWILLALGIIASGGNIVIVVGRPVGAAAYLGELVFTTRFRFDSGRRRWRFRDAGRSSPHPICDDIPHAMDSHF